MQPCNCEHFSHFDDVTSHEYAAELPTGANAWMVGNICPECAAGHYAQFVTSKARLHYLYGLSSTEILELQQRLSAGHSAASKRYVDLIWHGSRDGSLAALADELVTLVSDCTARYHSIAR